MRAAVPTMLYRSLPLLWMTAVRAQEAVGDGIGPLGDEAAGIPVELAGGGFLLLLAVLAGVAVLCWRLSRRLMTEIVRRRQAETALRATLDNTVEAVMWVGADFRLSAFNDRYAALTALPPVYLDSRPPVDEVLRRWAGEGAAAGEALAFGGKSLQPAFEHAGRRYHSKHIPQPDGGFMCMIRDVTEACERGGVGRHLCGHNALVRHLLDLAPIAIIASSCATGEILFVNRKVAEIAACAVEDILGRSVRDFYYDIADRERLWQVLEQHGEVRDFEVRARRADGSVYWALLSSVMGDFDGQPALISVVNDISARKRMEDELKQARTALEEVNDHLQRANHELAAVASTDSLTGLPNRRRLEEAAATEIARSRRYAQPLSVILFDVDWFKTVNDRFGHAVGDAVLREMGARLAVHMRGSDIFARWGGEEFLLLAPSTTLADATILAEKLRCLLADEPFDDAGHLTGSFGVAEFNGAEVFSALVGRADRALYAAKAAGRNRIEQAEA